MLAAPPQKRVVKTMQAVFLGVCMVLMLASYLVVLQPAYEPPMEDIYTDSTVIETDFSKGYILKHKDGTYSLVGDSQTCKMKKETAETFISDGWILVEE